MTFEPFFKTATGGNQPYDYQRRLAEDSGFQSRLIEIPTGLGKTAADVLAWLWNRVHLQQRDWPRRLVYCLPMRTLVEQTRENVRDWLAALGLTETVSLHILMGGDASGGKKVLLTSRFRKKDRKDYVAALTEFEAKRGGRCATRELTLRQRRKRMSGGSKTHMQR